MANFINKPSQQNYYFRKNNVYTEDNILVKKLFLYNIAAEVMSQEVQTYFEGFGEVLHLRLFPCKAKTTGRHIGVQTKTGFVHFADSRDAAKALKHKLHSLNGMRLCVKANDSWHQPDAYGLTETSLELRESSDMPPLIMMLTDDCLEHIIRLLPLIDRIHFARTCMRFGNVYRQVSAALNRNMKFETFDDMTVWDMRDFFSFSGAHVQQIEGVIPLGRCQRLCEFFGATCVNLQVMRAVYSNLSMRNKHKLFDKLTNLRELQLRDCVLTNASLLALKHLQSLKRLDLSENQQLTGLNMNLLPASIESLNLANCIELQPNYIPKFFKALPMLKELNLKGVYTIYPAFQQLVGGKYCDALEELTLSGGPLDKYEYIAKLPALKKIILYSFEQGTAIRAELLTWLVEHKAQQLMHLEARGQNFIEGQMIMQIRQLSELRTLKLPHNNLFGDRQLEALKLQHLEEINLMYWPILNNQGVLRLLLACPKLHVLHLQECMALSEKLLHEIISKIRQQVRDKVNQRQLPIKMYVYGTKINDLSLQHANVAAKDIIDATLEPPPCSQLCLHTISNMPDFDLHLDDYDSFGSEDELDPSYDRYMHNVGFLSDGDYEYDEMIINDDDLFELNMDSEIFKNWDGKVPSD